MTKCAVLIAAVVLSVATSANAQLGPPVGPVIVVNGNAGSDIGNDEQPDLATDGQGTWLAAWSSTENLGGSIGTDRDVFVCKSTDRGATWTPPQAVNSDATTDAGADFWVRICTDKKGNWLIAWVSNNDLSDLDIRFSRSTDNGDTWSAFGVLNSNGGADSGNDESPELMTDGMGNWLAVWHSTENLGATIGVDQDILIARSTDNGVSWTVPGALNGNAATDTGNDTYPRLATDGAGQWLATWDSVENLGGVLGVDSDILVARSTDHGTTWSSPAALNSNATTDTGSDNFPQIGVDEFGNWLAVWHSTENVAGTAGTDRDILHSVSTDTGATWSAVQLLNSNATTDAGEDFVPQVFPVQAGDWFAVWYSNDTLGGTIGADFDILAARSLDGGATWTSPEARTSQAAVDTGDDLIPRIASDGLGNWLVAWHSEETMGATVGADQDIVGARFALPDCNANGIGDALDISTGGSTDCDGDGKPNECDTGCPSPNAGTPCHLLDSDADGVDDCEDDCPATPTWATANASGCACSQLDDDGDGVQNCLDQCPDVPDLDADGDLVADCLDQCPGDAEKAKPGICGCGVPDFDSDEDGAYDCVDACIHDPTKSGPGVCGCGTPDTDVDGDGTPNCADNCPDDPSKSQPGICGCGASDADADRDGTPDCSDACPHDPIGSDFGTCHGLQLAADAPALSDEVPHDADDIDAPEPATATDQFAEEDASDDRDSLDDLPIKTDEIDAAGPPANTQLAPCGIGSLGAVAVVLLGLANLRVGTQRPGTLQRPR